MHASGGTRVGHGWDMGGTWVAHGWHTGGIPTGLLCNEPRTRSRQFVTGCCFVADPSQAPETVPRL
eukprot:307068-Chlamydomonas_euryale.AAC.6